MTNQDLKEWAEELLVDMNGRDEKNERWRYLPATRENRAALEKICAMLQEPTDEEKRKMLMAIDTYFPEYMPISEYTCPGKKFKDLFRALIMGEKRTVLREQLETMAKRIKFQVDYTVQEKLDYPMDIAIESTKAILAEFGITISDKGDVPVVSEEGWSNEEAKKS